MPFGMGKHFATAEQFSSTKETHAAAPERRGLPDAMAARTSSARRFRSDSTHRSVRRAESLAVQGSALDGRLSSAKTRSWRLRVSTNTRAMA
jgi:hypothetical protein